MVQSGCRQLNEQHHILFVYQTIVAGCFVVYLTTVTNIADCLCNRRSTDGAMGVCGGESIDAGETAWPSGSRTSGRTPVSADPAVLLCGPCVVESAGVSKHPINHESVAAGNKPVRLTRPVYQHIQTTSSSDSERPLDVGEDGDSPSLHENQLRRIKENVIAKLKELCPLESQDPVWLEVGCVLSSVTWLFLSNNVVSVPVGVQVCSVMCYLAVFA